jgi:uncharacterized protein YodC (DUF2158 family)
MSDKLEIGDLVELNSGSPALLVVGESNSPTEGPHVIVEWRCEGETITHSFPYVCVKRIGKAVIQ